MLWRGLLTCLACASGYVLPARCAASGFILPARAGALELSISDADSEAALLAQRIEMVTAGEAVCRAVLLRETLVPGQRLGMIAPPALVELFSARDGLPIILVGPDDRGRPPLFGVEASLGGAPEYRPVVPGIHPEGTADIILVAGRLCQLLQLESSTLGVQRRARVRWADELDGPPLAAETLARSEALTGRVEQWLGLVRRAGRERAPGHLDSVLADLGPMPDATRPSARALWVVGLINPLPALGASSLASPAQMGPSVAPEVRASMLAAEGVSARLSTAEMAIAESVCRLQKML